MNSYEYYELLEHILREPLSYLEEYEGKTNIDEFTLGIIKGFFYTVDSIYNEVYSYRRLYSIKYLKLIKELKLERIHSGLLKILMDNKYM